MSEEQYCPRNPDTATNLRCGKCGELVCPRCMVHAPVGVRCPKCGQATPLPTYHVSSSYLARAIATSLLLGLAGGLAFALIVRPLVYGFLYMAAMAGFGYLVGEGVSLATNRKRGRRLQYVAAAGIVAAHLVIAYTAIRPGAGVGLFDILAGGLAIYVAFVRLR